MKNLIIGVIVGMLLGSMVTIAVASSDISIEKLWNRVFDSTNNFIRVEGV